jgi:hypothetical protein
MAIVKYEVIAVMIEHVYYSRIVDIDDSVFVNRNDQLEQVKTHLDEDFMTFDSELWEEIGYECQDDFKLFEINLY